MEPIRLLCFDDGFHNKKSSTHPNRLDIGTLEGSSPSVVDGYDESAAKEHPIFLYYVLCQATRRAVT
jgi:hypothetical protein